MYKNENTERNKAVAKGKKPVLSRVVNAVSILAFCLALSLSFFTPVFAANQEFLKPLQNSKTLGILILGALGGAFAVYGILKLAFAFNEQDSTGMRTALISIGAAAILIGADLVYAFVFP